MEVRGWRGRCRRLTSHQQLALVLRVERQCRRTALFALANRSAAVVVLDQIVVILFLTHQLFAVVDDELVGRANQIVQREAARRYVQCAFALYYLRTCWLRLLLLLLLVLRKSLIAL